MWFLSFNHSLDLRFNWKKIYAKPFLAQWFLESAFTYHSAVDLCRETRERWIEWGNVMNLLSFDEEALRVKSDKEKKEIRELILIICWVIHTYLLAGCTHTDNHTMELLLSIQSKGISQHWSVMFCMLLVDVDFKLFDVSMVTRRMLCNNRGCSLQNTFQKLTGFLEKFYRKRRRSNADL